MEHKVLNEKTLYQLMREGMSQYKPLTQKVREASISKLRSWLAKTNNRYYLLLCGEIKDITLLRLKEKDTRHRLFLLGDLDECISSRGELIDVGINDDGVVEIWIRLYEKEKNDKIQDHCYFLCPYDTAIIES